MTQPTPDTDETQRLSDDAEYEQYYPARPVSPLSAEDEAVYESYFPNLNQESR